MTSDKITSERFVVKQLRGISTLYYRLHCYVSNGLSLTMFQPLNYINRLHVKKGSAKGFVQPATQEVTALQFRLTLVKKIAKRLAP